MTPTQLRIIAKSKALTLLEQQQARTPWHEREYLREARLGLQREWVRELVRIEKEEERKAR